MEEEAVIILLLPRKECEGMFIAHYSIPSQSIKVKSTIPKDRSYFFRLMSTPKESNIQSFYHTLKINGVAILMPIGLE